VPLGDGRSVPFETLDLSIEADPLGALRHGALTPLQSDLLVAGVGAIHCAAPDRGIPFHHAVISQAPDWFVEGVSEAVAAADRCGNEASFQGRMPVEAERAEAMLNEHSGRHFSPVLNVLYADAILGMVEPGGWPRQGEGRGRSR
jgi:hypothetical protein